MNNLNIDSLTELSELIFDLWTCTPSKDKDDSFTEMWGFTENEYKKGNKQFLEVFLLMVIKTNNVNHKSNLIDKYIELVG